MSLISRYLVTVVTALTWLGSGCNEELGIDADGILYACNSNDDCGFGGYTCQLSASLGKKVCRPPDYTEPDVLADAASDIEIKVEDTDVANDQVTNDTGPDIPLGVPCGPNGLLCPVGFVCDGGSGVCTNENLHYIAAGTFFMGCDSASIASCPQEEGPIHSVSVPGFLMQRFEATAAQYAACVDAGVCSAPGLAATVGRTCNYNVDGRSQHPINCLVQSQAADYCAWAGGRLCTEAEWEMAARGSCDTVDGDCAANMRPYPWGDGAPTCSLANYQGCADDTVPVGQHPEGASIYGIEDMSGNVREWVADGWNASYDGAPTDGSAWTSSFYFVKRGGGFPQTSDEMRATNRFYDFQDQPEVGGIRCCGDLETGPTACTTALDCVASLGQDPCQQRICNKGFCEAEPLSGVQCDDGNPCTENDQCAVGVCQGSAYECTSLQDCREPACDGQGGCNYSTKPGTCYISNKCYNVGDADPNGDGCTSCQPDSDSNWSSSPDDTPCKDGDTDGLCSAGSCVATPVPEPEPDAGGTDIVEPPSDAASGDTTPTDSGDGGDAGPNDVPADAGPGPDAATGDGASGDSAAPSDAAAETDTPPSDASKSETTDDTPSFGDSGS